jgi:hypothetical protein
MPAAAARFLAYGSCICRVRRAGRLGGGTWLSEKRFRVLGRRGRMYYEGNDGSDLDRGRRARWSYCTWRGGLVTV